MYCNIEDYSPNLINDSELPIDRYILSKVNLASNDVKQCLSNYDITSACNIISEFIDTLNNWYIRRSRNRFWDKATNKNAKDAYDTLYTVLNILLNTVYKIAILNQPFLPTSSKNILDLLNIKNEISYNFINKNLKVGLSLKQPKVIFPRIIR